MAKRKKRGQISLKVFKEMGHLDSFITTQYEKGIVTESELRELRILGKDTVENAIGDPETVGEIAQHIQAGADAMTSVLRHATLRIKQKLLEFHPALANELQNHMKGFERG